MTREERESLKRAIDRARRQRQGYAAEVPAGVVAFVRASLSTAWRTPEELRRATRLDPDRVSSALALLWAFGEVECELVGGQALYRPSVPIEACRDCRECGGPIATDKRADAQYCSRLCAQRMRSRRGRARAWKPQPVRACEFCGTLFEPPDPRKRFCRVNCAYTARNRRPGTHRLTCENCGGEFLSRKARQRFCCLPCSNETNRERILDWAEGRSLLDA